MTRRLLAVATRILPPADRTRYGEEFQSELTEIASGGRRVQLNAVRLLVSAWRLRTELRSPPLGKSISSTTFRLMRLSICGRRIERALDHHERPLAEYLAESLKKLSASVAVKSLSFVAPILGEIQFLAWPVRVFMVCGSRSIESSQFLTHSSTV